MRGISPLLPALKNKFKPTYPIRGRRVGSTVPRKQANDGGSGEEQQIVVEKDLPVVAFRRPPPLPPALGPLVFLSLLEALWNLDSNEE